MRDDLHKSVPPRTHWSRLLRLIQLPPDNPDLQEALVRAVRSDATWIGTPWGRDLEAALLLAEDDFFVEDKVQRKLIDLQTGSVSAPRLCALQFGSGLACTVRDAGEQGRGGDRPREHQFVPQAGQLAFPGSPWPCAINTCSLPSQRAASRRAKFSHSGVHIRLDGRLRCCHVKG